MEIKNNLRKNDFHIGCTLLQIATVTAILLGTASASATGVIKTLNFKPTKSGDIFEITYVGDASIEYKKNNLLKQIVLEASGIELPAKLTKVLATSSSSVLQVTPYNSGTSNEPIAKIVFQLKNDVQIETKKKQGFYSLIISSPRSDTNLLTLKTPSLNTSKVPNLSMRPAGKVWMERDEVKNIAAANEKNIEKSTDKSIEIAKALIQTLDAAPEEKVYKGVVVDFEATSVDVHDVFRLVGETSGLNLVTAEDVKGKITLSLKQVPWDQLLDLVLQQQQLRAKLVGNVIRIITFEAYTKEQDNKKQMIAVDDAIEPVVMAIIPLSFSKADEMKKMIEALLVKQAPPPDPNKQQGQQPPPPPNNQAQQNNNQKDPKDTKTLEQAFVRGKVEIDDRSNSLIVTNTSEAIERIRRLVKELDIALPQVLIESKIILAKEEFSRGMGFKWGGRMAGEAQRSGGAAGFNGGSGDLKTIPALAVSGSAAGSGPAGGGFGIQFGAGRNAQLQLNLSLAEANSTAKVVASPKVIVNNKKSASISDGQSALIITNNAQGSSSTSVSASLSLTVTPQITNTGSILMDLSISKSALVNASNGQVESKSISTQVLVDNGATLVLGGVYSLDVQKSRSGIPLLMDVPFLGALFRVQNEVQVKNELMVFITPRIMEVTQPNGASTIESGKL